MHHIFKSSPISYSLTQKVPALPDIADWKSVHFYIEKRLAAISYVSGINVNRWEMGDKVLEHNQQEFRSISELLDYDKGYLSWHNIQYEYLLF